MLLDPVDQPHEVGPAAAGRQHGAAQAVGAVRAEAVAAGAKLLDTEMRRMRVAKTEQEEMIFAVANRDKS